MHLSVRSYGTSEWSCQSPPGPSRHRLWAPPRLLVHGVWAAPRIYMSHLLPLSAWGTLTPTALIGEGLLPTRKAGCGVPTRAAGRVHLCTKAFQCAFFFLIEQTLTARARHPSEALTTLRNPEDSLQGLCGQSRGVRGPRGSHLRDRGFKRRARETKLGRRATAWDRMLFSPSYPLLTGQTRLLLVRVKAIAQGPLHVTW